MAVEGTETLVVKADCSQIKVAIEAFEELAIAADKAEKAMDSLKLYMQEKFIRE